jgi:tetratricopeptide (TPR) repeat protein
MKQTILLFTAILVNLLLTGQISPQKRDSVWNVVKNTADPAVKVTELRKLALSVMGDSMKLSDEYGNLAIITAEESRRPSLIVKAYLDNAERYRLIGAAAGNLQKAAAFAMRAISYAETVKDNDGLALASCMMASISRGKLEYSLALDYNNKAIALMPDLAHDSVKVTCFQSLGNTHAARNEKLPALKSYLNALQVAELSRNNALITDCYAVLSDFYKNIGQYNTARDYAFRTLEMNRSKGEAVDIVNSYNAIAAIYAAEKQYELAEAYYNKSRHVADSVKSEGMLLQYHFNMINLYFSSEQLKKGAAYFESHPQISSYVRNIGMGYQVDMAKGSIMAEMGLLDSAAAYLKRAEPQVERLAAPINRLSFYRQPAKTGAVPAAGRQYCPAGK